MLSFVVRWWVNGSQNYSQKSFEGNRNTQKSSSSKRLNSEITSLKERPQLFLKSCCTCSVNMTKHQANPWCCCIVCYLLLLWTNLHANSTSPKSSCQHLILLTSQSHDSQLVMIGCVCWERCWRRNYHEICLCRSSNGTINPHCTAHAKIGLPSIKTVTTARLHRLPIWVEAFHMESKSSEGRKYMYLWVGRCFFWISRPYFLLVWTERLAVLMITQKPNYIWSCHFIDRIPPSTELKQQQHPHLPYAWRDAWRGENSNVLALQCCT